MTTQDLNIIDIIKRNSKLTHSDLSIDEKEFAKHKNVLELLEKTSGVSTDLRAKLEKLDLDTLHYSYKIMCVHTCNDDVPMEYLFKYFAETEAKYNSSPLELFLINNGCGTPYKTNDWQYSKKFTGYITRTRINRELEDLCKLQSGLTDLEKKEILAMVVDKIVLKTEVEHTKLSRTMSMTIYPKAEFANRIPPTPIRFNINSHSAVCNWHIHGLGIKANRDKLMSQRISQRRHWLHDVLKWQKKIEADKLSIREFADKHKLQKSMLAQKLSLLKKLSDTCICYILNIKAKAETEILSFRQLERLSKKPKDRQFSGLKRLLKVSNTCPKK